MKWKDSQDQLVILRRSLKDSSIWRTFSIDLATIVIITLLVGLFAFILQQAVSSNLGVHTSDQLEMLAATAPEQLVPMLDDINQFLLITLLSAIIIITGILYVFSYSRKRVWSLLLGEKRRRGGIGRKVTLRKERRETLRWAGMSVVLGLFIGGYVFIVIFLKLLLSKILPAWAENPINLLFVLFFLLFAFVAFYVFFQKQRVWETIGFAFMILKEGWRKLLWPFIYILVGILVLNGLLILLRQILLLQQTLFVLFSLVLILLFIAWMRILVVIVIQSLRRD